MVPAGLRAYALAIAKGRRLPRGRFILFAQGRSGSELLGELIGSHPDVDWAGEILEAPVRMPRLWVEASCRNSSMCVFGFKAKIYQLTENQRIAHPKEWIARAHRAGWSLIYLWRSNIVRQVLSNMMMQSRQSWHDRVGAAEGPRPIHVEPDTLLEFCRRRQELQQQEQYVLEGLEFVDFNYENDLQDASTWQRTADRAFRHLGMRSVPVSTSLRRINALPLSSVITNYGDVQTALRLTPYERYLSDDG